MASTFTNKVCNTSTQGERENKNLSVSGDVGVTIALRQAEQQQQQQRQQQKQRHPHSNQYQPSQSSRGDSFLQQFQHNNNKSRQNSSSKRSCWTDLAIGLSLYITCLYLPTIYYSVSFLFNSIWCPLAKFVCQQLLGADAAWTDVVIIFLVSLSMAMIRITVIQRLVDMPSPTHVEAMVRCKSIHLLSSAYPQSLTPTRQRQVKSMTEGKAFGQEPTTDTGVVTSDSPDYPASRRHLHIPNMESAPSLPFLGTTWNDTEKIQSHKDPHDNKGVFKMTSLTTDTGARIVVSTTTLLQHDRSELTVLQPRPQKSHSMPIIKKSSSWVESTWESVRRSSQKALIVHENPNPRLHAAPRYATAVFRCMYCTFSLGTAWLCFSQSNIWPQALGGRSHAGATRHCWNLKGSLGVAEDFDGLDALLKLYYLLQASYHVHSGAFHVLTMVLLWSRRRRQQVEDSNQSDDDGGAKAGIVKKKDHRSSIRQSRPTAKPFTAYWRSLLQHGIALLLIGGSHLFASTRRLGAIGNFALDLSSLALHILQVCINAPISIPPLFIKILHRGIVIPLFIYCRFYIWPFVVWRSAMFESKEWLQQMESTLFPGIYQAMMYVFTGLSIILLGLNLVLFRRLFNHPHLQRFYNRVDKAKKRK